MPRKPQLDEHQTVNLRIPASLLERAERLLPSLLPLGGIGGTRSDVLRIVILEGLRACEESWLGLGPTVEQEHIRKCALAKLDRDLALTAKILLGRMRAIPRYADVTNHVRMERVVRAFGLELLSRRVRAAERRGEHLADIDEDVGVTGQSLGYDVRTPTKRTSKRASKRSSKKLP